MLKRNLQIIGFFMCIVLYHAQAMAQHKFTDRKDVQTFIHEMVVKHGFKKWSLIKLFDQVKMRPQVLKSINAPLEKLPWHNYQALFLTENRINGGVKFWNKHAATLAKAEKIYGVPASIIVATIGVETLYGKNKGEYRVIDALSNIAFSRSPRASYFKRELEEFLLLSKEQNLNPLKIKGSYAGAIGQPQFMPSSYRYYAINFSGNQHIDLSNNINDIIGSIANYYQKHGWQKHEVVAIPTKFLKNKYNKEAFLTLLNKNIDKKQLHHFGIYPYAQLPSKQRYQVIELENKSGHEYWLGLNNFEVIKRYNASDLYAMAVYQLSTHIRKQREKQHHA